MSTDMWTTDGLRITDDDVMQRLRNILEQSALIIEHRFFLGGRAPHLFICEDPEELERYVLNEARPGDSFWIWSFELVCRDENPVIGGAKVPDSEGRVPKGGAY